MWLRTKTSGMPHEAMQGRWTATLMSPGLSQQASATISVAISSPMLSGTGAARRVATTRPLARQLHAHQAGLLLEGQPVARHGAAVTLPGARQHEGGADIGMAGERQLGLGREDAHLGRVRGLLGRQHEGRLGEVELGRDRLHLRGLEALRIGDDGQRVAAESAVGEDVDGGEFDFHGADPSCSPRMA